MAQLGFSFNAERCIGCRACEAACKQQWNVPVGVRWRRVITREGGTYPQARINYISIACNHCDNPVCLQVCPVRAYTKRESDGVVILDSSKCIGCRYCVWACPYGAPQYDPETRRVSKCNFCFPRLDEGLPPACVQTCMTLALNFGSLDELPRTFGTSERVVRGFPTPAITRPSIRFKKAKHEV